MCVWLRPYKNVQNRWICKMLKCKIQASSCHCSWFSRATHLFPQRHLGVVGQHQLSVESLDISCDGQFIASCSHDQKIKFWNIKYFEDIQVDGKKKAKKAEINRNLPSSKCPNVSDFFSGLI